MTAFKNSVADYVLNKLIINLYSLRASDTFLRIKKTELLDDNK